MTHFNNQVLQSWSNLFNVPACLTLVRFSNTLALVHYCTPSPCYLGSEMITEIQIKIQKSSSGRLTLVHPDYFLLLQFSTLCPLLPILLGLNKFPRYSSLNFPLVSFDPFCIQHADLPQEFTRNVTILITAATIKQS